MGKIDGASGGGGTHGRGPISQQRHSVPAAGAGVRFGRLDEAIRAAVRQAAEAEEPRYIHRAMADFVILKYATSGTVAIVASNGRVSGPTAARPRKADRTAKRSRP